MDIFWFDMSEYLPYSRVYRNIAIYAISIFVRILMPQKCLFWGPGPPGIQVQTPPLKGPMLLRDVEIYYRLLSWQFFVTHVYRSADKAPTVWQNSKLKLMRYSTVGPTPWFLGRWCKRLEFLEASTRWFNKNLAKLDHFLNFRGETIRNKSLKQIVEVISYKPQKLAFYLSNWRL